MTRDDFQPPLGQSEPAEHGLGLAAGRLESDGSGIEQQLRTKVPDAEIRYVGRQQVAEEVS